MAANQNYSILYNETKITIKNIRALEIETMAIGKAVILNGCIEQ